VDNPSRRFLPGTAGCFVTRHRHYVDPLYLS